jgi:hypothetical protein
MEVNMKEVKIPQGFNPFKIKVNNVTYEYKPGEIVEVPDDVAEVIENYESYQNEDPAKKEYVEGFAFDPVADAGKAVMVDEEGKLAVGAGSGVGGTVPIITVVGGERTPADTKNFGMFGYFCKARDAKDWNPNASTNADYLRIPQAEQQEVITFIGTGFKTVIVSPLPIPADDSVVLIFIPTVVDFEVDVSGNVSGPVKADFGSVADGYIVNGDFTATISS